MSLSMSSLDMLEALPPSDDEQLVQECEQSEQPDQPEAEAAEPRPRGGAAEDPTQIELIVFLDFMVSFFGIVGSFFGRHSESASGTLRIDVQKSIFPVFSQ